MNNTKYCSVCGEEKELKVIPYINKEVYIDCQCEIELKEKAEKELTEEAKERYIHLRTRDSGIRKKEEGADLKTLTVDENNKKAVICAVYITNNLLNDTPEEKNGAVFYGTRGSGKTYIASAVINEFNKKHPLNEYAVEQIKRGISNGYKESLDINVTSLCKFVKEDELISLYGRYDYRNDSYPMDEYKKAKKLLVIDDVGASPAEEKKIQSALLNIIDYRHSELLSTIITTNLTPSEFKKYVGERCFDRLKASCFFVNISSDKSRRESK